MPGNFLDNKNGQNMTLYALVQNNQISRQQVFTETTPILSENKGVWLLIVDEPPLYDPETQRLETGDFVINPDNVTRQYAVTDLTEAELLSKPFTDLPAITLTRRQFRLALFNLDMLELIESAVDGEFKIFYEDSQTFHNHHPLLIEMAQALSLTPEQVHAVFTTGQSLE